MTFHALSITDGNYSCITSSDCEITNYYRQTVIEYTIFEMTTRDFVQSVDSYFLAVINNELTDEVWFTFLNDSMQ
jgi:hypothetical protein